MKNKHSIAKNHDDDDDDDETYSAFGGYDKKRKGLNYIVLNDICEESAYDFRYDFYRLEESNQEVIPIIIDSYGGDAYSCLSIVSLIESSNKKIATFCDSKAFSAGAIIFSCGHHGLRFISPHAYIMIHQLSAGNYGKFSDLSVDTQHCSELNSKIFAILDKNCRVKSKAKSFEKILMRGNNTDLYYGPKEAIAAGIADHIACPRIKNVCEAPKKTNSLVVYERK
jgi:ATP-dependent Clp protease protease subunit